MLRTAAFASAFVLLASAAQAAPVFFHTGLSGANESPANASTATGYADVYFDPVAHTMQVIVGFTGLSAPNTAAHIHCCTATPFALNQTAQVATTTPTFTGFPGGTTTGFYDHTFDMTLLSSYNLAFINNAINGGSIPTAEQTLFNGLVAGTAYLNVHSSAFPSGEIRGFLQVPEPLTLSIFGAGLAGAAALRRRRQALPR